MAYGNQITPSSYNQPKQPIAQNAEISTISRNNFNQLGTPTPVEL
jgi:hypothetical protein